MHEFFFHKKHYTIVSNIIIKTYKYFFYHEKIGESLRYILIGGSCAISDLLLLYVFVNFLHIWYLYAAAISFTAVSIVAFLGQKHFTFQNKSKKHSKQFMIFLLISGVGLILNSSCMFLFVSIAGIWYIFANIITKFIVLIWNFSANKFITFRTH